MDMSGFDAPGFSDQALAPSQANQQAVQVMKKKQGSGNWLTHLIPTAGAILGGIAGIPGDLFSAGASSVGGAALGSGFGKALENKLEGNNIGSGVVGDTVLGGVGQGGGMIAGHILGGAADVAKNYGTDLLSSVGGKLSKSEAQAFKLKDTTNTLANYGVKPNEFQDVANKVTGQNGIVTKLTRQAISKAKPVDTTGVDSLTKQLLANEPLLSGNSESKVMDVINNGLDNLNGRGSGFSSTGAPLSKGAAAGTRDVLNPGADPLDTFDFIKQLESKAATLTGNGKNPLGISDEAKATANVYKGVADELKDRLFTGSGADNAVANHLITPDTISELQGIRPGDKNWGQFVQKIMQSQTVGDLRSAAAPFVKGGMIQSAKEAAQQGGSGAGPLLKGAIDLGGIGLAGPTGGASLIPAAVAHTLGTDTGKTVVGNLLRDPTAKIPGMIAGPAGATADLASKILPQTLAHTPDLTNFSSPQTAMPGQSSTGGTGLLDNPGIQAKLQAFAANNSAVSNTTSTPDSSTPGASGYSNDELTQGISNAIQAGDIKAATEIQNLLKLNQSTATSSQNKISAVQQRNLAAVNSGIDGIQQIAQLWEGLGIGGGPGGIIKGKLQAVGAKLGIQDAAKAYGDQRKELAISIARAINMGTGQGSNMTADAIENALPSTSDTHGSAVKKLNNLMDRLLSAQKEIVSVPTYAGDNQSSADTFTGSGFSSNPADVQFAQ